MIPILMRTARSRYMHGMVNVERDPICSEWIDVAKPNR
jgi:hypothetical protein